jgi:hypothetical protein
VPYIVAFGYLSHQEGTPRLLDLNHLAQLAKRIEAEYGCKPLFSEARALSRPWRPARRSSAFRNGCWNRFRLMKG